MVMRAIGNGISDSAGGSIRKDPCLPAGSITPPEGMDWGRGRETLGDGQMDGDWHWCEREGKREIEIILRKQREKCGSFVLTSML